MVLFPLKKVTNLVPNSDLGDVKGSQSDSLLKSKARFAKYGFNRFITPKFTIIRFRLKSLAEKSLIIKITCHIYYIPDKVLLAKILNYILFILYIYIKDKKAANEKGPAFILNGVKLYAKQLLDSEKYFEPFVYYASSLSEPNKYNI